MQEIERQHSTQQKLHGEHYRASGLLWARAGIGSLFFGAGLVKILGVDRVEAMFALWGIPEGWMVAIGLFEVLCSVLVLLPRTSMFASIALAVLMVGASLTHITAGQMGLALVPAAMLCVLVAMIGRMARGVERGYVESPG